MNEFNILFFSFLVISAITQIDSVPAGGNGNSPNPRKPQGSGNPKTHSVEENILTESRNERLNSPHRDLAGTSSDTGPRRSEAVPGDRGFYTSSENAGPSRERPSDTSHHNSQIIGGNSKEPITYSADILNPSRKRTHSGDDSSLGDAVPRKEKVSTKDVGTSMERIEKSSQSSSNKAGSSGREFLAPPQLVIQGAGRERIDGYKMAARDSNDNHVYLYFAITNNLAGYVERLQVPISVQMAYLEAGIRQMVFRTANGRTYEWKADPRAHLAIIPDNDNGIVVGYLRSGISNPPDPIGEQPRRKVEVRDLYNNVVQLDLRIVGTPQGLQTHTTVPQSVRHAYLEAGVRQTVFTLPDSRIFHYDFIAERVTPPELMQINGDSITYVDNNNLNPHPHSMKSSSTGRYIKIYDSSGHRSQFESQFFEIEPSRFKEVLIIPNFLTRLLERLRITQAVFYAPNGRIFDMDISLHRGTARERLSNYRGPVGDPFSADAAITIQIPGGQPRVIQVPMEVRNSPRFYAEWYELNLRDLHRNPPLPEAANNMDHNFSDSDSEVGSMSGSDADSGLEMHDSFEILGR